MDRPREEVLSPCPLMRPLVAAAFIRRSDRPRRRADQTIGIARAVLLSALAADRLCNRLVRPALLRRLRQPIAFSQIWSELVVLAGRQR